MSPQFWLMGIFLLSGLMIALVSLPLIASRVPRNHLYGFRTAKTLSADEIWYPANRYSGRQMLGAGLATAAASLLLLPFAAWLPIDAVGLLGTALMLTPLGVALYRSFRYLNKFERGRDFGTGSDG